MAVDCGPRGRSKQSAGIGEQLGVRHFSDGDFTAIEHLDGFSVQLVGNFADSCQIAILGPFDQLVCNPAQGKRLAPIDPYDRQECRASDPYL